MYEQTGLHAGLMQGDIFDACRLLMWMIDDEDNWIPKQVEGRAIVVTQSCDLENQPVGRIQVATVHEARHLVEAGIVKAQTIRDQVRRHRVYGWYFLPACEWLPESVIDLRSIHSVPREMLVEVAANGGRICRLVTPCREHMAQHFAVTYSRIALPEPYPTTD
jgi:hypothetical protein